MKRLLLAVCLALGATAGPASAANLCVGAGAGCFATLQEAVDAAHEGDTIHMGRGTFAGGVTIDKSVAVVGAGSHSTIIAGGGPVLTIFREPDPENLTVSIRGVMITGGVNDSAPDPAVTFGGGVFIPVKQLSGPPFNGAGATVAIADSVITGNRVTSHEVIPPGPFCDLGPFPCGFNTGGGIDNGGVLTVTNTRITNNTAGTTPALATVASGASGGGIVNRRASSLELMHSVVSGNRAVVSEPNAQRANAGGISSNGALTIEHSVVSGNRAEVAGSNPGDDAQESLAGGLLLDSSQTATIRDTLIHGNRAITDVTDPDTLSSAFAGGMLAGGPLLMERSRVTGNLARAKATGPAAVDGGGLEVGGAVTIRNSVIGWNTLVADAKGAAGAVGGGIANAGQLTLERTLVTHNRVKARGAGGTLPFGEPSAALGGGIFNLSFGGPPTTLTLTDSAIVGNSLGAPEGFLIQGGGLHTTIPVTRTRTVIAGNKPDQCFGC